MCVTLRCIRTKSERKEVRSRKGKFVPRSRFEQKELEISKRISCLPPYSGAEYNLESGKRGGRVCNHTLLRNRLSEAKETGATYTCGKYIHTHSRGE